MNSVTPSVILLPATHNFEKPIAKIVPYETLRRFVPTSFVDSLSRTCGGTGVASWGLTPGKLGQHVQKWNDLKVHDVGVFTRQKGAFAIGQVVSKIHSAPLARHLWGRDAEGLTWEYVFFLCPVQTLRPCIPYETLARALGYKPTWIVGGAQLIKTPDSAALLELLPKSAQASGAETVHADRDAEQTLDELLELDARREI